MVLKYSDFLSVLNRNALLKIGLAVDTNVLISATYDSDKFFEATIEFFDYLAELKIPIYCNVNVKAEFLEIHRRIIFTEALIDFFDEVDRSIISIKLLSELGKLSSKNKKRIQDGKMPVRLSEHEIKQFKLLLIKIECGGENLWSLLCKSKISNKLVSLWNQTESELGLNFLSTRHEKTSPLFKSAPDWGEVIKLIEYQGLSSSDAMILNLFFCSNLEAIVTSDLEISHLIKTSTNLKKICFAPDLLI